MPSVRNMMYAACSAALFFTACSKEKNENPVSGLYVSANLVMYDSVKLYTKSGIITDTTIIHGALERRWKNVTFNLRAGKDSVKKDMTVNIDPEGGDNYIDFKTYKRAYEIAGNGNGLTLLLTKDSLTETSVGGPFPVKNVFDCSTAYDLIRKYQASFSYRNEGTNTYYRTARRYAILEESAGYLTYPGISYLYTRHSNGSSVCIASFQDINNQFNEVIPAILENEDTLIIQINRLQLIKR
jgi:hypothetical protein